MQQRAYIYRQNRLSLSSYVLSGWINPQRVNTAERSATSLSSSQGRRGQKHQLLVDILRRVTPLCSSPSDACKVCLARLLWEGLGGGWHFPWHQNPRRRAPVASGPGSNLCGFNCAESQGSEAGTFPGSFPGRLAVSKPAPMWPGPNPPPSISIPLTWGIRAYFFTPGGASKTSAPLGW